VHFGSVLRVALELSVIVCVRAEQRVVPDDVAEVAFPSSEQAQQVPRVHGSKVVGPRVHAVSAVLLGGVVISPVTQPPDADLHAPLNA